MNADQLRDAYARTLREFVKVRRYAGTGASRHMWEVTVRAKATQYDASELVETIQQGDWKIILLTQDLLDQDFVPPMTTAYKVVVKGKELSIVNPGERKAMTGEVVAYELQCRG